MKKVKLFKAVSILLVLAVLAGGVYLGSRLLFPAKVTAAAEPLKTAVSTRGDVLIAVSADGISRLSVTSLGFRSSGTIAEIKVQEGQAVKAGDILASLGIDNLQNQVAQAQANFDAATAKLAKLQAGPSASEIAVKQAAIDAAKQSVYYEYKIVAEKQALYDDGKTSYADLLAEKSKLESAKGQQKAAEYSLTLLKQIDPNDVIVAEQLVSQMKAAMDMAIYNLESVRLKAPATGTILTVNGKVGETASATATAQNAFIIMTDSDKVYLDAAVYEDDISKIEMGMAVDITFNAFPGDKFSGKVVSISRIAVTDASGIIKYTVGVVLDKADDRIRSGMTASLALIFQKAANAVTIPNEAVVRIERSSMVEVMLADGTTEMRKVSTGLTDGTRVEVTTGLNAGETVVLRKVVS